MAQNIGLIGAPRDAGASCRGSATGPWALRTAGIRQQLENLGVAFQDNGNIVGPEAPHPNITAAIKHLDEVKFWVEHLYAATSHLLKNDTLPILLGGDHSLAIGSIWAARVHAEKRKTPLHVIWFDAHSDFNTHTSSTSGNIHGMPVSVITGDMRGVFDLPIYIPQKNIHLVGIRDVDPLEKERLQKSSINIYDMQEVDERGIDKIMSEIMHKVDQGKGCLHISFDIDVMDPDVMPGIGTRP